MLRDITIESRFIDKLAESCAQLIEDRFEEALESGDILDTDEPNWASEDEMFQYRDERLAKIIKMVAQSLTS